MGFSLRLMLARACICLGFCFSGTARRAGCVFGRLFMVVNNRLVDVSIAIVGAGLKECIFVLSHA